MSLKVGNCANWANTVFCVKSAYLTLKCLICVIFAAIWGVLRSY